jgi:chitinase
MIMVSRSPHHLLIGICDGSRLTCFGNTFLGSILCLTICECDILLCEQHGPNKSIRHGSWDAPGTYIGPYVYAHTNKTEIKESLDLFWRMGVPADRINLGIGFYGRSYTLEDANCNKPGCKHSAPGVAGQCTGESGILSFAEIESYIKRFNLEKIYDKEAGVKYLAWGSNNQWVSYDDEETLQDKVDFAKEQG